MTWARLNGLDFIYEGLQISLKRIHIRPKRSHPMDLESLLDVSLLSASVRHLGEAEVYAFVY